MGQGPGSPAPTKDDVGSVLLIPFRATGCPAGKLGNQDLLRQIPLDRFFNQQTYILPLIDPELTNKSGMCASRAGRYAEALGGGGAERALQIGLKVSS